MVLLKVYKYGEPVLRKKAKLVKKIDLGIQNLIKNMFQTMYDAPGIGLAAPQIGESLRLIVVDLQLREKNPGPLVLINPMIVERRGRKWNEEGCLSIPGPVTKVPRAIFVKVQAQDKNGKTMIYEATGLLAQCIQHEIDHLDGRLIIHRTSLSGRAKMWWEIRKRKRAKLW